MFLARTQTQPVEPVSRPVSWNGAGTLLVSVLLISVAIPLIEWSVPQRYPVLTDQALIQNEWSDNVVLENGERISASDLQSFLQKETEAKIIYGRALYPSYYEKSKFWGEASANLLEASKYNRLQFTLIGSKNIFVFIPLQEAPLYFPHASDVFVVGCLKRTGIQALIIKVNDQILGRSPWQGLSCSMTE
jgi:hypothetical protein